MKNRGAFLVIALLVTATAITACRRETPEPKGLGGPVPAQHVTR
ncbi:MAG: hypothetical protein ACFCUN_05340 [Hyphomicrobiaceae bacterium]